MEPPCLWDQTPSSVPHSWRAIPLGASPHGAGPIRPPIVPLMSGAIPLETGPWRPLSLRPDPHPPALLPKERLGSAPFFFPNNGLRLPGNAV